VALLRHGGFKGRWFELWGGDDQIGEFSPDEHGKLASKIMQLAIEKNAAKRQMEMAL
jgi:hypothetical protein